jgi:outer membrane lipoprotein-sorting protein
MVRLFIDTNTNLPKSVIYSGKDGVSYTIRFNKITANQPVSNSEFVFNEKAHPGVEVIDMR